MVWYIEHGNFVANSYERDWNGLLCFHLSWTNQHVRFGWSVSQLLISTFKLCFAHAQIECYIYMTAIRGFNLWCDQFGLWLGHCNLRTWWWMFIGFFRKILYLNFLSTNRNMQGCLNAIVWSTNLTYREFYTSCVFVKIKIWRKMQIWRKRCMLCWSS